MPKIKASVWCEGKSCGSLMGYCLADVRIYNDMPICKDCYEFLHDDTGTWLDLPPVTLDMLVED